MLFKKKEPAFSYSPSPYFMIFFSPKYFYVTAPGLNLTHVGYLAVAYALLVATCRI